MVVVLLFKLFLAVSARANYFFVYFNHFYHCSFLGVISQFFQNFSLFYLKFILLLLFAQGFYFELRPLFIPTYGAKDARKPPNNLFPHSNFFISLLIFYPH